jgi:glycosyltransferase involved in cell wall biosynthesis
LQLAIVMPVYNEAEGIFDFIVELKTSFSNYDVQFCIVNDSSSDTTLEQIYKLQSTGINVQLHNNSYNVGHGISTLTALRLGLESQAKLIIAIDGDGQFTGQDVARVYLEISSGKFDLVEGIRTKKNESFYRRIVSHVTRQLIAARSGKRPIDANTPLRAYKRSTLELLLELVPHNSLIPNLYISAISRKKNYKIGFVDVHFIPRRGSNRQGSTWGNSKSWLPSKKFLSFCVRAFKDWFSL